MVLVCVLQIAHVREARNELLDLLDMERPQKKQ